MAKQPRFGMNVPEAGNSRIGNLFAGLGKFGIDSLSGKRDELLDQRRLDRRRESDWLAGVDKNALDLAKSYMIDQQVADQVGAKPGQSLADAMKEKNIQQAGRIRFQATVSHQGDPNKPQPNQTGATADTSQPTTEDGAPSASTGGGKRGTKAKTPNVSKPAAKKPYVTKKEVEDAVSSGNSKEGEVLGLNKAYDSMVAKREDGAGKMDTKPKTGKPKKSTPAKSKKPSLPPMGKNGNSGSSNGNKKGGM